MRWLHRSRWVSMVLISLTIFVYLTVLKWALPFLWPYRDHALVHVLLDLISGGHLPDIVHEIGLPI